VVRDESNKGRGSCGWCSEPRLRASRKISSCLWRETSLETSTMNQHDDGRHRQHEKQAKNFFAAVYSTGRFDSLSRDHRQSRIT
jgi:molybdenum cofactor biosynthesis enzyme MoaA